MPFNFPNSPSVNDTVTVGTVVYEWDGTAWRRATEATFTVVTAVTQPVSPADGELWFDETDGTLNVWYDDGSNAQWVTASGPPGVSIATGGGSDQVFWENETVVTSDYTITNGRNAMSAGPVTIDTGVTVTVGSGETWRIV